MRFDSPLRAPAMLLLAAPLFAPLPAQEPRPARERPPARPDAEDRVRSATGVDLAVFRSKLRRNMIRTDTPYGFLVDEVDPESPAARAGVEEGWILMKWAGQPIREVDELDAWLWELPSGAEVEVDYTRKNERAPIWSRDPWESGAVTLVLGREHPLRARWGLGVFAPEGAARARPAPGLAIHDVVDGSPAARAGVQTGDVIVAWRGVDVAALADIRRIEVEADPDQALELVVRRGDTVRRTLEFRLEVAEPGGER